MDAVDRAWRLVDLLLRQRLILIPDLTAATAVLYPSLSMFVRKKLLQYRSDSKTAAYLPLLPDMPAMLPATAITSVEDGDQKAMDLELQAVEKAAQQASKKDVKKKASDVTGMPPEDRYARVLTHPSIRCKYGPWTANALTQAKVVTPAPAARDLFELMATGQKEPYLPKLFDKITAGTVVSYCK